MLVLPTKGFSVSVSVHNVRLDCLAEWIEGCVTFEQDHISHSDVIDMLLEGNIYKEQDFAKERVDDAFAELNRRARCLGKSCPFIVESRGVRRLHQWDQVPAYAFCLLLALQVPYRSAFTKKFGTDFTEQGLLFERLTTESLGQIGWKTHSTGWSKTSANSIEAKVEALASHLGEGVSEGAVSRWTPPQAKDGGLDVVCHLPFPDGWGGRPLYYVQCASGEDWKEKRTTPNLALWDKLLDLVTRPTRGIAIPFALLADQFRRDALCDGLSLFMDRHRLCTPVEGIDPSWLSPTLAKELKRWAKSRLAVLSKLKA
jgi:hypothetical protein